jgi:pimeloyl-ACP methyl ester carboxylesterase
VTPHDFSLTRDDGRLLSCRRTGFDDGPLVVYLHGAPSSRLDVNGLHEQSAARGVQLVSVDRPGYGGSAYDDYTFTTVADDVIAVVDHARTDSAFLVGQSAGAAYALATAALHPDRITAVCAAGGGAPFAPDQEWWGQLSESEQEGVQLLGVDDARASQLLADADRPFMDALDEDDAGLLAFWRSVCGPADQRLLDTDFGPNILVPSVRESLRQGQQGWARDNVVRMGSWSFDLAAIRCPALILYGEEDHWQPGEWVVERCPTARLQRWPDLGHFAVFEHWDRVLDELAVT